MSTTDLGRDELEAGELPPCLLVDDVLHLGVDRREHRVTEREREPEAVQRARVLVVLRVRVRVHSSSARDVAGKHRVLEPTQYARCELHRCRGAGVESRKLIDGRRIRARHLRRHLL